MLKKSLEIRYKPLKGGSVGFQGCGKSLYSIFCSTAVINVGDPLKNAL